MAKLADHMQTHHTHCDDKPFKWPYCDYLSVACNCLKLVKNRHQGEKAADSQVDVMPPASVQLGLHEDAHLAVAAVPTPLVPVEVQRAWGSRQSSHHLSARRNVGGTRWIGKDSEEISCVASHASAGSMWEALQLPFFSCTSVVFSWTGSRFSLW